MANILRQNEERDKLWLSASDKVKFKVKALHLHNNRKLDFHLLNKNKAAINVRGENASDQRNSAEKDEKKIEMPTCIINEHTQPSSFSHSLKINPTFYFIGTILCSLHLLTHFIFHIFFVVCTMVHTSLCLAR